MSTLRSFLLESHMPEHFIRAVYAVLPLVEATNINKQFLVQQAGSPEGFKEARERVQAAWDSAQMGNIVKGNLLQKLVNYPPPKGGELLVFASAELLVHGKHIASLA